MSLTGMGRPGIKVEQIGRVLVGRINGGDRAEFGPEVAADLAALVSRADEDGSVGAVVLTGTHPERFVAHADVRWLQQEGAAGPSMKPGFASGVLSATSAGRRRGIRQILQRTPLNGALQLLDLHATLTQMNTSGATFIAALNGSALGIGSEIALACDYRLMAAGDYVIGQPEVLVGIPPAGGGTQRLTRLVGLRVALQIMLEGASLSPEEAAAVGYIDEVVDGDALLSRAMERAQRQSCRIKSTVAAIKRATYIGGSQSLAEGLRLEGAEFLSILGQPATQAAMLAYIRQSDELKDLALYDPVSYKRSREAGRFAP